MRTKRERSDLRAGICPRRGFTLVELLVVMVVIGILVGMLLPAVQSVRESARRSSCSNNMRQIGLGCLNYEASKKLMPSGGEGTDYTTSPPSTIFDLHSTFTLILPYIEQGSVYKQFDLNYTYRDIRAPLNQAAAKQSIPIYLCPADPWLALEDPFGYGKLDYFCTVYTDIDGDPASPTYGLRAKMKRADGALCVPEAPLSAVSDGTSSTILAIEDTGRNYPTQLYKTLSKYPDPACAAGNCDPDDAAGTNNNRTVHRWADPDAGGSGVSGPPNNTVSSLHFVNNNAIPMGGRPGTAPTIGNTPTDPGPGQPCPWTTNNCGINDEPFSFHPGGCNAVFADGSVRFLDELIEPVVMRGLVTRAEGLNVQVP